MWFPRLATEAADHPARRCACILLWMSGGPSQIDTFDPKPGHANGGEFASIDTAAAGVQFCEHLPRLATLADKLAVIRSMSSKEGDHSRATYLMRTGYRPEGPVRYPTLGSLLSKELKREETDLPNFISIGPFQQLNPAAFGPGFLGPQYAPLIIGGGGQPNPDHYEAALRVANLALPAEVTRTQADARMKLLSGIEDEFSRPRPSEWIDSHRSAYERALRLMRSDAVRAFKLDDEPPETRDRYGRNRFGQSCLLARRLIEQGVPFVGVSLNGVSGQSVFGWDTHVNNFEFVKRLSETLDSAWASLMEDLDSRGLLESTLIVWMGEFGRTPKINSNSGRDHYPAAWTTVLAGGGIRGGQAVGRTGEDGMKVEDRPVSVRDFMATICHALGIDSQRQNMSNVGRPIRIVDPDAEPVREVLT